MKKKKEKKGKKSIFMWFKKEAGESTKGSKSSGISTIYSRCCK